jgi:hypothetical protein
MAWECKSLSVVKGFYQFLKKNAAIPFSLPRTAKSKASNKVAEDVKDEL